MLIVRSARANVGEFTMNLIEDIKRWFGFDTEGIAILTCEDCAGRFTKTEDALEEIEVVRCPTCDSTDVSGVP